MTQKQPRPLDRGEIVRLCGNVVDEQVLAILDLGANMEELEEAAAYMAGEDDILGKERRPLAGRVAQIYEILTRDDEWQDDLFPPPEEE